MPKSTRIEMFGELRVIQDSRRISRFRSRQGAALLAFLAFHPNREYRREELIEMFWPDAEWESGRNRLSIALTHLRHILEDPQAKSGSIFSLHQNTVQMFSNEIQTDVVEFEEFLRRARHAESPVERSFLLNSATTLYLGPFLNSLDADWIAGPRQALADQYREALLMLSNDLLEIGDSSGSEQAARRLVSNDATDEEAYRLLISRLADGGNVKAATAHYRELERVLQREGLGPPERATQELISRIRSLAKNIKDRKVPRASSSSTEDVVSRVPEPSTVSVLLVELVDLVQIRKKAGMSFAPSWTSFQELIIHRAESNGGILTKYGDSLIAITFPTASTALSGALGIIGDMNVHGLQTLASNTRFALHTGEATGRAGVCALEDQRVITESMELLASTPSGAFFCSEESAVLLRSRMSVKEQIRDLGLYRVGNGRSVRRIYAVSYDEPLNVPSQPLGTPIALGRLPAPPNRLIGRDEELDGLCVALRDERTRLVTLTGTGGVGKSRLAMEAAIRLSIELNGSCWFVPLASVRDTSRLEEVIREVLGYAKVSAAPAFQDIIAVLGAQPSLVVLDNLEHLFPDVRDLIHRVITEVPTLTVLTTSRQVVGLSTETVRPVSPLKVPDEKSTAESLQSVPSVQMFIERARAAQGEFHLTRTNAQGVADLCRRLDGIPLAIELLAAHIQVLSPAEMLRRLDQKLDISSSRRRDSDDRHRSLRAAFEWSWDLLPKDVQAVFASLSIFQGGWTLPAAELICGTEVTLDSLTYLCESSLLQTQADEVETRYTMLETVREFAASMVLPDQLENLRKRHLDYFLRFIESIRTEIQGSDQADLLRKVDRDHGNLRYALSCGAATHEGMLLAVAMGWYWHIRGFAREAVASLRACLDSCVDPPYGLLAKAYNGGAVFSAEIGDFEAAEHYHQEALKIRTRLEDKPGIAASLNNLGIVARNRLELAAARQYFADSLAMAREGDDVRKVGQALLNLGGVCTELGDLSSARQAIEEGLSVFQTLEDPWGIAVVHQNLGEVDRLSGDLASAKERFLASIPVWIELNDQACLAGSIRSLSYILAEQQHFPIVARLLGAADRIHREVSLPLTPQEKAEYDTCKARTCAMLGKSQFDLIFDSGRDSAVEQTLIRVIHFSSAPARSIPAKEADESTSLHQL